MNIWLRLSFLHLPAQETPLCITFHVVRHVQIIVFYNWKKKNPSQEVPELGALGIVYWDHFAITFEILFILLPSGISSVLNLDLVWRLSLYCFFLVWRSTSSNLVRKGYTETVFLFFLDFAGLKISLVCPCMHAPVMSKLFCDRMDHCRQALCPSNISGKNTGVVCPFPSQGIFSWPGMNSAPVSPALSDRFFPVPPGRPCFVLYLDYNFGWILNSYRK